MTLPITAAELMTDDELLALHPKPIDRFVPVLLSSIDASRPLPLLLDRLDPGEHTILFGPGGVGKGALAASWITRLTNAGSPVLILDYEGHGGEWSRRIEGLGGDTSKVVYLAPAKAGLGAIWDHAERVRDLIANDPDTYIVIDSAVMACAGGDPMDPATASRFYAALQVIGRPSLTLAHVTKLHDVRYPFGSVFWHNLARVTWSLMSKGDDVLLTCQKASNWQKPAAASVGMLWLDGILTEVSERRAIVVLTDRIMAVLSGGALTVTDIAEALNEGVPKEERTAAATVRTLLNRELKTDRSRVTVTDGQWSLRPES